MKNYGYVNNMGEVKQIQLNTYTGEGYYVGITRNGFAYVYVDGQMKKLTKAEIGTYLGISSDEVMQLLRSRGNIELASSKGSDFVEVAKTVGRNRKDPSNNVEKPLNDGVVVDADLDNRKVREKSAKARSTSKQDKVNLKNGDLHTESQSNDSEVSSLEESSKPKLSLKNRVKHIEKTYVTKEQLIEVIKAITEGE